jgi:ribonucleoside-diphosphate reductase alpha chain
MTNLTPNARKVLEKRYLAKDVDGSITETSEELFGRVAKAIASAETLYGKSSEEIQEIESKFFKMMCDLDFLPNSPTLMNAGRPLGQLAACFVLPIEDTMDGIFDAIKHSALIHKSGGGTGFSFSRIRPKGSIVASTNGVACLTGDTVLYNLHPKRSVDKQEITISQLYKISQRNRQYPQKIKCMVDEGVLGTNAIEDVIYSGRELVYEIVTKLGYKIKATKNHRFLENTFKWKKVEEFKAGEVIGVNGVALSDDRVVSDLSCKRCGRVRPLRGSKSKYFGYCENCVVSIIKGCTLKGSAEYYTNLAVTGKRHSIFLSQTEIKEKRRKENLGELNPMWKGVHANEKTARDRVKTWYPEMDFSTCALCGSKDRRIEVHHRDMNVYNNAKDNLQVLCCSCHQSEHQKTKSFGNPRLMREVYFDEILSITECGVEDVYDICMKAPYHNFVANGFISHNSGPISFMKVFNSATEAVKQGGTRRGANMGMLRIDHPDILEFIKCKSDNAEITNFNISVAITEKFMEAVERGEDYNLIHPSTGEVTGQLNAKEVFDLIVEMAWKNGEPGIIFIDRMNKYNPTPDVGEYESTNPCGEQILLPFEACNLGSVNLLNMVVPIEGTDDYMFDWEKLDSTVKTAVRFLDNVIDVNNYPLPEIDAMTRANRKIGLGVMGWSDMLFRLKIPYNSDRATELAEKVMARISNVGWEKSKVLAKEKGTFPNWEKSIFGLTDMNTSVRNATVTTIAPTGTLSIIAGVSSGIEPLFAISFIKNVMDNDELPEVNPYFEEIAKSRGFYSTELMRKIADKGTIHGMEEIPLDVRELFVTAHDITPEWHIKTQAAFQCNVDNAISKTINFCNNATKEDVAEAYWLAYRLGCKGTTIYRDGSRDFQVLNIKEVKGKENQKEISEEVTPTLKELSIEVVEPRPRPDLVMGFTEKVKIACGNLYITVNKDDKGVCEVFTNTGRAGGCPAQSEATSRVVSIALRAGIEAKAIVEQLKGIRCPSTTRQKGLKVMSCPDAIGRMIEKAITMSTSVVPESFKEVVEDKAEPVSDISGCGDCSSCSMQSFCGKSSEDIESKCPECGSIVEHGSGCVTCRSCGWGRCG